MEPVIWGAVILIVGVPLICLLVGQIVQIATTIVPIVVGGFVVIGILGAIVGAIFPSKEEPYSSDDDSSDD
jgi:hypothetical protein